MTEQQYEDYLKTHHEVRGEFEYPKDCDEKTMPIGVLFRHEGLQWYKDNPNGWTRIDKQKFYEMTPDELDHQIRKGVDVVPISRVTGYFAKVNGWNPGKMGELKDRYRDGFVEVSGCGVTGEDIEELQAEFSI